MMILRFRLGLDDGKVVVLGVFWSCAEVGSSASVLDWRSEMMRAPSARDWSQPP